MSKLGFDKFINKKSAGKVKEEHRQEKRKSKAALRAAGDEFRRQKLEKQRGAPSAPREDENFRGGKSYRERNADGSKDAKGSSRVPQRGANGRFTKSGDRNERSDRAGRDNRDSRFNKDNRDSRDRKDVREKRGGEKGKSFERNNYNNNDRSHGGSGRSNDERKGPGKFVVKNNRDEPLQSPVETRPSKVKAPDDGTMPLNKYIAHSGVCGRREAAELVKQGQVQVNGDIVFEPAIKISEKDKVKLKGKILTLQQKFFYFLLNKPKDHITTTKDEKGRRTVLDLFKDVEAKHLYPVGRLDRNTTGVLLITNDGELAQQLTHPSFEVKKIYEVTLERPVAKKDLDSIASGLSLEDGEIKADQVGYPDSKNKAVVGIEIHSGKNRIVRRIFEHLGYEVKKLDRVMFAGLTKKNVERGKWRYLSEKEVRLLKYMNAGGSKKAKKAEIAAEQAAETDAAAETPVAKRAKRTRMPADLKAKGIKDKKATPKTSTEAASRPAPKNKAVKKSGPRTGKATKKEKN